MLIATALIAAASGMPVTDPKSVRTIAPVCQQTGPQKAGEARDGTVYRGKTPLTHSLAKEPNADAIAAVLYTEGQCSRPIVISRNLGNNPMRK